MKQFIKNHWKAILIILIIILGFIIYYEVLPKYNLEVANYGYNTALNDLANNKELPVFVNQGNQTAVSIVKVCSQTFIDNYDNICGVQG